MLKLVGKQDDYYAIRDTEDNSLDIISEFELSLCLKLSLEVAGVSLNNDGSVSYTEEFFPKPVDIGTSSNYEFDDDEDYDEEDDEDYDYSSDYEDEDEDDDESEDDYEEDDEFEDDYEDEDDELEGDYEDEEDDDYLDYDYYEDEEEEEDSTVNKLYNYLTPEQIKVLKRYYLWYSQRIFTDAQKDPTFGMKSASALKRKKENLNNLRNTGGLWHYAGFVDTGRMNGGTCTLGHSLRYMHLAWDVTVSDIETAFFGERYDIDFEEVIHSNNCIIFGIKCIADFFEVSKECVSALQGAQRDSLKDMGLLLKYYEQGIVDTISNEFTIMDEFVNAVKAKDSMGAVMKKDYKPIVPLSLSTFYLQFRTLGMIPPKSLVQEIRDKFVGWETHRFTGRLRKLDNNSIVYDKMRLLLGKKSSTLVDNLQSYSYNSMLFLIQNYLAVYFFYEICGHYKYNADNNKDEGGASKSVKSELYSLYGSIRRFFWSDIEYSLGYLSRLCVVYDKMVKYVRRDDRFKGYDVIKNYDTNRYEVSERQTVYKTSLIEEYSSKFESKFEKAIDFVSDLQSNYSLRRGRDKSYTLSEFESVLDDYLEVLDSNIDKFKSYCYDTSKNLCNKMNDELEKQEKEEAERLRLKEESENSNNNSDKDKVKELEADTSIKTTIDVVNYLKGVDLNSVSVSSNADFGKKILETVVKSGKEPTYNQFYYLKMLYEEVSGNKCDISMNKSEKESIDSDKELKEALIYMVDNKDLGLLDDKTYAIISSIVKYGSMSSKQKVYALKAKEVYDEKVK